MSPYTRKRLLEDHGVRERVIGALVPATIILNIVSLQFFSLYGNLHQPQLNTPDHIFESMDLAHSHSIFYAGLAVLLSLAIIAARGRLVGAMLLVLSLAIVNRVSINY